MKPKLFLSAMWEHLIIASYIVEHDLLKPHLPSGLELDTIDGNAFVSLVAFSFNETKVKGIKVPFHVNFPEINLRFYVKSANRRGVVFIRELVPRYFIALIANKLYNENYRSTPMKSEIVTGPDKITCTHKLKIDNRPYSIQIEAENNPFVPPDNSTEHFFKEHNWGFGQTRKGVTLAYRVEHTVWEVYPVDRFEHNLDFGTVYGEKWKSLNHQKPYNIAFARGSGVKVFSSESFSK